MLKFWITSLIVITFFAVLIYAADQHILRMDANDPQIQLAEDAAVNLANGLPPQSLTGPVKIAIGKSLAPFIIIYDSTGQPIASSGTLNGKIPWLPPAVLQYAKQNGEDRITWEPQSGVRIAAVIDSYSGNTDNVDGFVVSGRSLREVENRENDLTLEVGIAWITISIVASIPFMIALWQQRKRKKKSKKKK